MPRAKAGSRVIDISSIAFVITGLIGLVLALLQLYPTLRFGFVDDRDLHPALRRFSETRKRDPKAYWMHVLFLVAWVAICVYVIGHGLDLI
jgi:hypothetical protein